MKKENNKIMTELNPIPVDVEINGKDNYHYEDVNPKTLLEVLKVLDKVGTREK